MCPYQRHKTHSKMLFRVIISGELHHLTTRFVYVAEMVAGVIKLRRVENQPAAPQRFLSVTTTTPFESIKD
jgi:hypothetical protein